MRGEPLGLVADMRRARVLAAGDVLEQVGPILQIADVGLVAVVVVIVVVLRGRAQASRAGSGPGSTSWLASSLATPGCEVYPDVGREGNPTGPGVTNFTADQR